MEESQEGYNNQLYNKFIQLKKLTLCNLIWQVILVSLS